MLNTIISIVITLLGFQGPANSAAPAADVRPQESRAHPTAQEISQMQSEATAGNPSAELRLARAYQLGDGISQDTQLAAEWYRKAADSGNPEAQNALGIIYMTGDGVVRDKAQAVTWYRNAARQGYAEAMVNLGKAYYNGDGVGIDDAYAFAWFTLAKEAGSQDGIKALDTTAGDRKPWTTADGYKDIAGLYAKDGLFGENPAQAARWWLMAAKGGDPDSQMATADILLNGRGVPQDFVNGRHWCEQATKIDDQRAFYCLGEIYRRGLGVRRDPKLARTWYERSGRQRNPAAIRALAEMDVAGEGEKPNRESACVRYAALVISLGDKDDALKLATLKKQMDPKEWKKVQQQLLLMKIDPAKLDIALQQVVNR
jgi:uncharacterized protein